MTQPISRFTPVAPPAVPCKCCGSSAPLLGVADFNKSCAELHGPPMPLAGIPIYYHRCPACGFMFTTAFDNLSPDELRELIYNEEYSAVDPDYMQTRPRRNAEFLGRIFRDHKALRILDYGSGAGVMARLLREQGFGQVVEYDPFVAEAATPPAGAFDLITCFEVVEHCTRPRAAFDDMISRLADDAMLMFSTLFQPPDILKLGVAWWYAAPRNGHVSLHTVASIRRLIDPHGLRMVSTPDGIVHLAFRDVPAFARHLNIPGPTEAASRRNPDQA